MIYGNLNWNKFFDDYTNTFVQTRMSPKYLISNVLQTSDYEKNYTKDGEYFMVEVPGFNKSNLTVEIDGRNLIVSGKKTYRVNGQETEKTISKVIDIGEIHDLSQIEATVEDGILTVFNPKKKETKPNKIKIL